MDASTANEERPTWQVSRAYYQAQRGVHQPWVGEISGVQLGLMGKRARAAYSAKRSAEWDASHACGVAYAKECFDAYAADPSILSSRLLARDARDAITSAISRWEEAQAAQRLAAARATNSDMAAVKVGDRVWALLGSRYLRVTKVFKQSLRGTCETSGRECKVAIRACLWLKPSDLTSAVSS